MKNIGFTVFQNIWETESSSVMSFDELMIILSSEQMKSRIEDLRGITNDDERKKRKCYLPNITVNGIFPHRCDNGLTYYNQITALDFDSIDKAKELVNKVGSHISYYKVGLELFVSSGPAIIDWLKSENKN